MTGAEDDVTRDEAAIHAVGDVFFAAFASGRGQDRRFDALRSVVLPSAVITRITGRGWRIAAVAWHDDPRRDRARTDA
ncbi:hypothetical protein SAMN04489867_2881 [Pedococcus dokdonensis]|uniref:Uncharacterized protein n=1 Tax=Pedococcus dokdonensis TaxID=443156 RepID=A0A1H0TMU8_9MICO|nr:hypothetical protein [Pedococcus dokdonensis]SDP54968.1 hypothetical protein SAMN04489867_2881 [Pedococcus dokdonensis]